MRREQSVISAKQTCLEMKKEEKIPPNNNRRWYYKEAAAADGRTFEKSNRSAVVKLVFTFTEREYYMHNIYI